MIGTLNYAAPRARCPKAMTYGIVSTGIATVVCALPALINAATALMQNTFSKPFASQFPSDASIYIVLATALAMLLLPLLGLLFAGLSVAKSHRDYQCAMLGFVVNCSGLFAAIGALCWW